MLEALENAVMRRRFISLMLLAGLLSLAWPSAAQGVLFIQLEPGELQQGRTGLLRVMPPSPIDAAQIRYNSQRIPLYPSVEGEWVGFIPAAMTSTRGENQFTIFTFRDGAEAYPPQTQTFNIVWGSFFYQDIQLPYAVSDLLNPDLNAREEALLRSTHRRITPENYWQGNLQQPVPGMLISEFGGIRTYNDGVYEGRHTGADYRAGTGEPAMAAGHGRVVFANFLDIRGNHIVIDHGLGIFTGYSHLSDILVVPGQRVLAGDIIGAVGTTGRSQGAHMHLELAVYGVWVDPPQFMSLPIPEMAPAQHIQTTEDANDG